LHCDARAEGGAVSEGAAVRSRSVRGHRGGLLFLFANGFLEFGGAEGVVEPGGEDDEEDDQKGDDVGARSFGGSGHGEAKGS
jgi:hypothetical protein